MNELKCPGCGRVFTVDESDYDSIVRQVRDSEFESDIRRQTELLQGQFDAKVELLKSKHANEVGKLESECALFEERVRNENRAKYESQIQDLERQIHDFEVQRTGFEQSVEMRSRLRVQELESQLQVARTESELELRTLRESYDQRLHDKDEQIAYYRDLKARQSTKMVGETLEQHCETEFNKLRSLGFQGVYFEKDNDARTGSKGDYIYRETDESGVEVLSIMFEMKNQMDTTDERSKHKNADFFKELDKDRREKKCEFAVLVSLLETDSELYNQGIVDVSHRYPKMYVIRPQFFIPMITLLRNAARSALSYKRELAMVRSQNIDVAAFEGKLDDFKTKFSKNHETAKKKVGEAIEEIDKAISWLEKAKAALQSCENNVRLAGDKLDDLTIKKLVSGNSGMRKAFEEAGLL